MNTLACVEISAIPVFDAHCHAFPDAIAARAIRTLEAGAKYYPVRGHADGRIASLLASMDHAGISRAIMCSVATSAAQVPKITDWSAAAASDRIIPFASVHPDAQQPEEEIERIASLGIRGLKFHPQYMNCPADDPRTLRIARAAARRGLAMAIHAGYDLSFERSDIASPRRIRNLHEAVPDLRLQACHLGGWEQWEEALELIAGQRIFIETSFCFGQCPPEFLNRILEKHPAEYVMFGTDSPWADQSAELAAFRALGMDSQWMHGAMWLNANRFVGLDG